MYSRISGAPLKLSDIEVQMFLSPGSHKNAQAFVMLDNNRLPQFEKNGEVLAINPQLYDTWKTNLDRTGPVDFLATGWAYTQASVERYYRLFDTAPAPERDSELVPVDILLRDPQHILLHEVSLFVPIRVFLLTFPAVLYEYMWLTSIIALSHCTTWVANPRNQSVG